MFHPDGPTLFELIRQGLASTQEGYDLLAPKFDRTPFRTPEPIAIAMARAIGEKRSIGSALDLCCGTAAVLSRLRPLCRERVVGVDFSPGMLREASRRMQDAEGTATVELVRGDALALTFDQEFDVVTSASAFGHVERKDEDRFVAGIARALRPRGRFVFPTTRRPSPSSPWFWAAHGFNAVMRVRNALRRPPFVMYYLTFLWPDVKPLLARHGLDAVAASSTPDHPYESTVVVVATKG